MGNASQNTTQPTPPWNHWYHVTIHVYGSWLHGNPRGWRARHHREHIDGDYKSPPPFGKYDDGYERSTSLMNRDAVRISIDLRQFVANAVAEKLREDGIQVLIVSADSKHTHVLARFLDHDVRHWVGRAKKHASHSLRQHALRADPGGLWAKRCHPEPITDRRHQLRVFKYILDHTKQGARIWRFDRETPPPNDYAPPAKKAHG